MSWHAYFHAFRRLYWSEPGRIRRSNFDGSQIEDFITEDATLVTGMTIQYGRLLSDVDSQLLWVDSAGSDVRAVALDGSDRRRFAAQSSLVNASHVAAIEVCYTMHSCRMTLEQNTSSCFRTCWS